MAIVRPLLTDPNEDVRYDTAMVLGRVPTPEAVELLRQVVDREPESVVGGAAIMALARITPLSIPVLREMAMSPDRRKASLGIRGLSDATAEDLTPLFLELYERWDDESVRIACIESLYEHRMRRTVSLLRTIQDRGSPREAKNAAYWIAEAEKGY
jgi:HEAT repeat protein